MVRSKSDGKPRRTQSGLSRRKLSTDTVRKPRGGKGVPAAGPAPATNQDYTGWRNILNPVWCYNGFITAVGALTVFGLLMVFSSSSVDMVADGESPWSQVASQALYGVLGVVVGVIAMHLPLMLYKRASFAFLAFGFMLQALTFTPLGISVNGNSGWIGFGSISFQPAEVLKLALCLWLPVALESSQKRAKDSGSLKSYAVPAAGFAMAFLLVMAGKDLGTAMIIVLIGVVAFLLGGFPLRWLLSIGVVGAVGIVGFFVLGNQNRISRILAAYKPCTASDVQGVCYQSIHGLYAMASGGLTGVGLGNSREKWNYLPEAHNDFIFAVIGEELGFIGACMVILAFVVMGWCLLRVAWLSRDGYARMVMVGIAAWIVSQALINICVVLGILPVMGLPLPFVSAGGTALIMCLISAGVAARMMRSLPEIRGAVAQA
ncbi:MAG: peptidoglycan glycosyltransferase FtsW [Bifidobacterium psychraerophilum]